MCDAPAFHHGPRPLVADCQARASANPRCLRERARVKGRFHRRQSSTRSLRRIQPSSSSKTFFTSVSRNYVPQPRKIGFNFPMNRCRFCPRPCRNSARSFSLNRFTEAAATFNRGS